MRSNNSKDGDVLPLAIFDILGWVIPTNSASLVIDTPFDLLTSFILNTISYLIRRYIVCKYTHYLP